MYNALINNTCFWACLKYGIRFAQPPTPATLQTDFFFHILSHFAYCTAHTAKYLYLIFLLKFWLRFSFSSKKSDKKKVLAKEIKQRNKFRKTSTKFKKKKNNKNKIQSEKFILFLGMAKSFNKKRIRFCKFQRKCYIRCKYCTFNFTISW